MNLDQIVRKTGVGFVSDVKKVAKKAEKVKISETGAQFWKDLHAACEREEDRIKSRKRIEDEKEKQAKEAKAAEAVEQDDLKKKAKEDEAKKKADAKAAKKNPPEGNPNE